MHSKGQRDITLTLVPFEKVPPLYDGRRAALTLNVLVVGAGLGGLAVAHSFAHADRRVIILESSPVLGTGIQLSPNQSRLVIRWGLGLTLAPPRACCQRLSSSCRYNTGERIGYTRWGRDMALDYGAPYYQIHRADYHTLLLRLALTHPGVHIRLGATVSDVQPDPAVEGGPNVTLASGEVIHADLIIAADGVRNSIQKIVMGHDHRPMATGDTAHRATIPTELLLRSPELRPFVEAPTMTSYCIVGSVFEKKNISVASSGFKIQRSKSVFNMMMLHPDDGSIESCSEEGCGDKMRADFADFEPRSVPTVQTYY